jgi:hypothetical protein
MNRHLHHPFRVIGAALALAGALTAVVVLVLPGAAIGGRPSGKNEVRYYTNSKGQSTGKVGEDEKFIVVGKNLNHTVEVFCFAGEAADDVDGHDGFDVATSWANGPTSKTLIDVEMDSDCGDKRSAIQVQFDNNTPGDETDDIFVTGPGVTVGPVQS